MLSANQAAQQRVVRQAYVCLWANTPKDSRVALNVDMCVCTSLYG
jgi:hypothetical protein